MEHHAPVPCALRQAIPICTEHGQRWAHQGCGEAQGYVFSQPVPASEVLAVVGKLQRIGIALA
jgi:hypothetical protein